MRPCFARLENASMPLQAALEASGLPVQARREIVRILRASPAVARAVLFGSRAKGTAKPGSDIDLALFGDTLALDALLSLASQFAESDLLPWHVDLVDYNSISSLPLKAHIDRVGIPIYERDVWEGKI